jgi:hypothetical protein
MPDEPLRDRIGIRGASQHPIIPLIIAALLAGFGMDLSMALYGLAACALWLCIDTRPWAMRFSRCLANRHSSFYDHIGGFGRDWAEVRRTHLTKAYFSIYALLECAASYFS